MVSNQAAVRAAKIDGFRHAIVAVGAQQDFGSGPIGADVGQQAAQEALGLLAAGAFGGTQHRSDETSRTVEDDGRLKTVFLVKDRPWRVP